MRPPLAAAAVLTCLALGCTSGRDPDDSSATPPESAPVSDSNAAALSEGAFGRIQIGMTVEQAEDASGIELVQAERAPGEVAEAVPLIPGCAIFKPSATDEIGFITDGGRILVIVVRGEARTDRGISVGDTRSDAEAAYGLDPSDSYPNRRKVLQATLRPTAGEETGMVLVMDPPGEVVEEIRAGAWPSVETYDNGCRSPDPSGQG